MAHQWISAPRNQRVVASMVYGRALLQYRRCGGPSPGHCGRLPGRFPEHDSDRCAGCSTRSPTGLRRESMIRPRIPYCPSPVLPVEGEGQSGCRIRLWDAYPGLGKACRRKTSKADDDAPWILLSGNIPNLLQGWRERGRRKKPSVSAISRTRSLNRDGNVARTTRFTERCDVFLPCPIIEVHSEKPACLIQKERVHSHHLQSFEMLLDLLVGNGIERVLTAVGATRRPRCARTLYLCTEQRIPLVGASRRIASLCRLAALPAACKNIFSAAKQSAKDLNFLPA